MNLNQFGTEFGYAVKRTQQAYRDRMDDSLAVFDLSTPQYVALAALDHLGGASNAELARACFVTPQAMHAIIAGLQRRELIQRPTTAESGRALVAQLTDDGRARFSEAAQVVLRLDKEAVGGIGAAQLSSAVDVLRRVGGNLRGDPGHADTPPSP